MQKLNYVKIPSWCKCTFKNRAARRIALRLYQTSSINSSKEIRVDYAQSNTTILTSIINIIRYQQQLHVSALHVGHHQVVTLDQGRGPP